MRKLIKNVNVFDKSAYIVGDEERENYYTNISEDILSHTYFCEKISNEKGISVVPINMLKEELALKRKKFKRR